MDESSPLATAAVAMIDPQPKGRHLCLAKGDGEDFKYSIIWLIATAIFMAISASLG